MLRTTLFNCSSLRFLSHHPTHSLPTLLAHAGIAPSSNNDGLAPALNLSTTYERNADNSYNSHVYSRLSNPTRDALEQEISNFETNGSSLRYLSHHTTHSLPTLLAHAGIAPSSNNDGLAPALNLSTTYERNADNSYNSHVYSRLSNPTRDALEQEISNFETCYASRPPNLPPSPTSAFASGMAAVSSVLLARPNTTVLLPDDCYHGVPYQLDAILHRCGVTFELIDMTDHYIVENKLKTLNENEGANSSR